MCSHFLKTKRVTKLLKYCNVYSRDAHTGHCLFKYGLLSLRMRGHIYVEFAPTWGAATSQRELLVRWELKRWSRGPKCTHWEAFSALGRRGCIHTLRVYTFVKEFIKLSLKNSEKIRGLRITLVHQVFQIPQRNGQQQKQHPCYWLLRF